MDFFLDHPWLFFILALLGALLFFGMVIAVSVYVPLAIFRHFNIL